MALTVVQGTQAVKYRYTTSTQKQCHYEGFK